MCMFEYIFTLMHVLQTLVALVTRSKPLFPGQMVPLGVALYLRRLQPVHCLRLQPCLLMMVDVGNVRCVALESHHHLENDDVNKLT